MANEINTLLTFSQGSVPSMLSKLALFERRELLERLDASRHRVRIIEAPAFYGKSVVAYQYATNFFQDKGVSWVDASKTLFLHAFKKRDLLEKLCLTLSGAKLVVLDNLPKLTQQSQRALATTLLFLLRNKIEIIITCRVSPFTKNTDIPSVFFKTKDLLLTPQELRRHVKWAAVHEAENIRVNALSENDQEGSVNRLLPYTFNAVTDVRQRRELKASKLTDSAADPLLSLALEQDNNKCDGASDSYLLQQEQLPQPEQLPFGIKDNLRLKNIPFVRFHAEQNLGLFVAHLTERPNTTPKELCEIFLLILHEGDKSKLASLFSPLFLESYVEVGKTFPHVGFQEERQSFSTLELPLVARRLLLRKNLRTLTALSLFDSRSDFLLHVVESLATAHQYSLMFQLARDLLPVETQLTIFRKYARQGCAYGHAQEVVELAERIGESSLEDEEDLLLFAQVLQDAGHTRYCSMVLGRISELYARRPIESQQRDKREQTKDFVIDVLSGFKVTHCGESFPQKGSIRHKARVLLTLLVVNHKHELSRQWLSRVLWPDSSEDKRRRNFYNLWCYVRKLFERSKGNCPYFFSNAQAVQLNDKYVDSDVMTLEGICSDFINQRKPAMGYAGSLEWIERISMESFMPGVECPEVKTQGRVMRNQLVDALLVASERLLRQDQKTLSLRFVQKAYLCDRSREDTCYLLMQMLKTVGQYSKAISAFTGHRSIMIKKYGIESSRRIGLLYEEILEELA